MNTTGERIIEVEITAEHVEEMRANGVPDDEIPSVGTIKRYRPSRHIIREKVEIPIDRDIVEHFKRKVRANSAEVYQSAINRTLREAIKIND